LPIPIGIEGRR